MLYNFSRKKLQMEIHALRKEEDYVERNECGSSAEA